METQPIVFFDIREKYKALGEEMQNDSGVSALGVMQPTAVISPRSIED